MFYQQLINATIWTIKQFLTVKCMSGGDTIKKPPENSGGRLNTLKTYENNLPPKIKQEAGVLDREQIRIQLNYN